MIKKCLMLVGTASLLASMSLVVLGAAAPALAVSGAVSTTDNPTWTDTYDSYANNACLNGNGVNCNIYNDKRDVWLSGLPVSASLGAGTYFFAVLSPGGQPNPNDCAPLKANGDPANLSDTTPCETTATGAGDTWAHRVFSVDGSGTLTYPAAGGYLSGHDFDTTNNKIQLFPYDDTPNSGGVYILAVCELPAAAVAPPDGPGVKPSDCKYDAFKVNKSVCATCGGGGQGLPLSITKDAAGSYTTTFKWGISKDVDNNSVTTAGGNSTTANYTVTVTHDDGTVSGVKVTGTIDVFNPNTANVTGVDVTDALSGAVVQGCTVTGGTGATVSTGDNNFPYECDLSALPDPTVELDNTATASWGAQDLSPDGPLVAGDANFTFPNVSFTGTTVHDCVTVSDPNDPITDTSDPNYLPATVCSGDASPTTFKYTGTISGDAGTCTPNKNTATITDGDTQLGSADQTVTDCQGADLTVTKTATPSFTRTYNWTIKKTVDKPGHIDQHGGTVTLNYNVTATETGFTDSNWQVNGTITVHNPNDWESVTLTGVTDTIDNNGSCTVSGNTTQTIAAGADSTGLTYSCTYTSAPSPASGTNTATATWNATAASTPDGSKDGAALYNFGSVSPSTVNQTITVQDAYNGGTATTLGTLTATDSVPFTTHTYGPISHVIPVPTNGTCVTITNAGIIKETGAESDVSNTICGTGGVGALTMGYWQNKNGQGVIAAGASTLGVCNVGTYLRTFNPFKDLSTTAPCGKAGSTSNNDVVGYTYNIIKAANASGASMNAMLRAQMLATALDVYFGGGGGGNKIGASSVIGTDKIDLTAICSMIDTSSGTGTCSGTLLNVTGAFPGITGGSCATVNNLLAFANATFGSNQTWGTNYVASANTGSNWYNQVKATQQLAKNTFDAINNQAAFAC
ncbi:MAG TPA: hypothetical protein VKR30_01725 [Candidatus Limnocylindrales bacterium]|nr:hypothetical protein [Candidatus Limnocylindrales bacterium]